MITGDLKRKVDALWTEFWTGGISNPMTVVEQISYLMFIRILDIREDMSERILNQGGRAELIFPKDRPELRWRNFKTQSADKMIETVRDQVFPFIKTHLASESGVARYLKDAQFMIDKPGLLVSAVNQISLLPLERADTKGELYEYVLSKLNTAGINGQFRTPRHIIRTMIEMMDPTADMTIADPACGTAGFLATTMEYLNEKYTSPEFVIEQKDADGTPYKIYPGDQLEPFRRHLQSDAFVGFDFDQTMLRIAAMNMLLHGIEEPSINYMDTLCNRFEERAPQFATDHFDLILANPPFKGSLDAEGVASSLKRKVTTKKTELLFLMLMERMLKVGGRAAVIVPDGVLFGSSGAHKKVRKALIEDNQLEAVISLPSGVFKPYAGVSTAILIFSKGGKTKNVFFYDVQADGFSLDDKRTEIKDNDLPTLVEQWKQWAGGTTSSLSAFEDRKAKAFYVPRTELEENAFDLSISRYKEHTYEEVEYDDPKTIIATIRDNSKVSADAIDKIEELLK